MAHDVFISYASEDKTVANAVCGTLEANGVRCWIAPRDVIAGQRYGEAIIEAILGCRIMVLVFSSHANASEHIPNEIERAMSNGVTIMPFRIEEVMPGKSLDYFIGSVHWLDALSPPLEEHLQRLASNVQILLSRGAPEGERKPEERPRPPVAPVARAAAAPTAAGPPVAAPAGRPAWIYAALGAMAVVTIVALVGLLFFRKSATSVETTPAPVTSTAAPAPANSTQRSERPGSKAGEVRENPRDGLKYVWIPPGTFMMGCSPGDSECSEDEKPRHRVTIGSGFWIGQTEVTVGAYQRFANATGRQMPAAPGFNADWANQDMPVVSVNWDEAQAYCEWSGSRLLTEAEWEYAARAGSTDSRYAPLDEAAWYDKNSGGRTHPVGQKRANGFGLYDTLGNAWEWVNDWYDEKYYQSSQSYAPVGPASGQLRVLRGGSWSEGASYIRVTYRGKGLPGSRLDISGMRCAR